MNRNSQSVKKHKILVVDDEPNIRDLLAQSLRFAGFAVRTVSNGAKAISAVMEEQPSLAIVDVMLPDISGFSITRNLRDSGFDFPILFLTAKDHTEDKIEGLRAGGDDYITKPFSIEEIIARITAILRRTSAPTEQENIVSVGEIEIHKDTNEVFVNSKQIDLSPTEFRLLTYLVDNHDRVVSKSQLLENVWNQDPDSLADAGIVESYISYLRRKIDEHATEPIIQTKRGFGYIIKSPHKPLKEDQDTTPSSGYYTL